MNYPGKIIPCSRIKLDAVVKIVSQDFIMSKVNKNDSKLWKYIKGETSL